MSTKGDVVMTDMQRLFFLPLLLGFVRLDLFCVMYLEHGGRQSLHFLTLLYLTLPCACLCVCGIETVWLDPNLLAGELGIECFAFEEEHPQMPEKGTA